MATSDWQLLKTVLDKGIEKMFAKNALLWALLASLSLAFSGCGGDPGYDLSGTVTFDGKPIPQGKIYFAPDNTKKNTGLTGYADIKDGKYNTAAPGGKKHVGGPMIVKIEGFDPMESGPEIPSETGGETTIKSLFPGYETGADLAKSKSTKDFDVPPTAAQRQVDPENGKPPSDKPVDGV